MRVVVGLEVCVAVHGWWCGSLKCYRGYGLSFQKPLGFPWVAGSFTARQQRAAKPGGFLRDCGGVSEQGPGAYTLTNVWAWRPAYSGPLRGGLPSTAPLKRGFPNHLLHQIPGGTSRLAPSGFGRPRPSVPHQPRRKAPLQGGRWKVVRPLGGRTRTGIATLPERSDVAGSTCGPPGIGEEGGLQPTMSG